MELRGRCKKRERGEIGNREGGLHDEREEKRVREANIRSVGQR